MTHLFVMAGAYTVNYDPTDTGKVSEEYAAKRDYYYEKLRRMRNELSLTARSKVPDGQLYKLACALIDGTVFDIVRELEEIQQLNERSLLNRRMKVIGEHKTQRVQMMKRHRKEVNASQSKPHNLPLIESRHDQELAELEVQLSDQIHSTDQALILELDQIVIEQQSTLVQAAVPFFHVTNNPQDIKVQMSILDFIQRLSNEQLDSNPKTL